MCVTAVSLFTGTVMGKEKTGKKGENIMTIMVVLSSLSQCFRTESIKKRGVHFVCCASNAFSFHYSGLYSVLSEGCVQDHCVALVLDMADGGNF